MNSGHSNKTGKLKFYHGKQFKHHSIGIDISEALHDSDDHLDTLVELYYSINSWKPRLSLSIGIA